MLLLTHYYTRWRVDITNTAYIIRRITDTRIRNINYQYSGISALRALPLGCYWRLLPPLPEAERAFRRHY